MNTSPARTVGVMNARARADPRWEITSTHSR
jgi:hypothetical protein